MEKQSYVRLLRDYFGQCAVEELFWATQGSFLPVCRKKVTPGYQGSFRPVYCGKAKLDYSGIILANIMEELLWVT